MKFKFSQQSKLFGREVVGEVDRFSYIPCDTDTGLAEYVLCYEAGVPKPEDEPFLFDGADVDVQSEEEVHLKYPGLDEMVILMTTAEDGRFRKAQPDVVAQNEMFVIEK